MDIENLTTTILTASSFYFYSTTATKTTNNNNYGGNDDDDDIQSTQMISNQFQQLHDFILNQTLMSTTMMTTTNEFDQLQEQSTLPSSLLSSSVNELSSTSGPTSTMSDFVGFAEKLSHLLTFYYTPILVFTGSIGNILSVLVFFKTKLRKLSSSYYLAALGISDTCFLFFLFLTWLSFIDVNIYNRPVWCQLITYLTYVFSFLSVWFVVAFTVERFIAVLYPLKRQTMCTVRRAKMVLVCLTILGAIHSTPYIIFSVPQYSERGNNTICGANEDYKVSLLFLSYSTSFKVLTNQHNLQL